ncbi:hypothetical protein Sm713_50630 [Streptomyces sp. TS71-3]|nr:hypothetical protein Sm713_50630 [Streptomyces sp. TS71-3]
MLSVVTVDGSIESGSLTDEIVQGGLNWSTTLDNSSRAVAMTVKGLCPGGIGPCKPTRRFAQKRGCPSGHCPAGSLDTPGVRVALNRLRAGKTAGIAGGWGGGGRRGRGQ